MPFMLFMVNFALKLNHENKETEMMTWVGWPYVAIGLVVLVVVLAALALYNRREQRRYRARDLAAILTEWGLKRLGNVFAAYSVGDYSGLMIEIHRLHELLEKEGLPMVFKDLGRKLFVHFVGIPEDRAWYLDQIAAVEARAAKGAVVNPAAPPPTAAP
jgi:hypothetical protein